MRRTAASRGFAYAVDGLVRLAGGIAVACLAAIFVILVAELVSRNLFSRSFAGSWELASYLMAAMFFLGLAPALGAGTHVRVEMLSRFLDERASRRAQRLAQGVVLAVALGASGFAAYTLFDLAFISWSRNARSWELSLPLFWPQLAIALGMGLLALAFAARLVTVIATLAVDVPDGDGT